MTVYSKETYGNFIITRTMQNGGTHTTQLTSQGGPPASQALMQRVMKYRAEDAQLTRKAQLQIGREHQAKIQIQTKLENDKKSQQVQQTLNARVSEQETQAAILTAQLEKQRAINAEQNETNAKQAGKLGSLTIGLGSLKTEIDKQQLKNEDLRNINERLVKEEQKNELLAVKLSQENAKNEQLADSVALLQAELLAMKQRQEVMEAKQRSQIQEQAQNLSNTQLAVQITETKFIQQNDQLSTRLTVDEQRLSHLEERTSEDKKETEIKLTQQNDKLNQCVKSVTNLAQMVLENK